MTLITLINLLLQLIISLWEILKRLGIGGVVVTV